MGLPVRTLVGITGLAGAAVVALGYLTFSTAVSQRSDIVEANHANVDAITARVGDYGLTNGRWDGVQRLVKELADEADAHIRLTSEAGAPLADTDTGAASDRDSPSTSDPSTSDPAVSDTAIKVTPRPAFFLISGQEIDAAAITLQEIRRFRRDSALAACWSAAGIKVESATDPNGVPRLTPSANTSPEAVQQVNARCSAAAGVPVELAADSAAVRRCFDPVMIRVGAGCLQRAFAERTAPVTADSVLLYVSARRAEPVFPITPMVGLNAAMLILALTGAALAGRSLYLEIDHASLRVIEGADVQVAEMSRYVDEMTTSLKQKEEEQRQRIAAVTHELRTPLANIRAYLEGLSDGIIQPEPELFASLHDEAMLQQRIIDDLRGNSAAKGDSVDTGVELDLAELVKSACAAQRPAAESAGIRLSIAPGRVPVTGDADRLRQVLGNLISNALRYTPAGGAVEVRTGQEDGRAMVQVIDTGIGIAEEDLPRVFDREWRSDQARSLVADGSGLGLAITRQFVVDHGGAIFVDSRPGLGTAFTVVLPLAKSTAGREVER